MIYLDSSVVLAHALSQRQVDAALWKQPLTSSRLLQYEIWNRLHAYRASAYRHGKARRVLSRVIFQEMTTGTLVRALRPFQPSVKTLDGLHLATMEHLRMQGVPTTLASYDLGLLAAAQAMGFAAIQP